MTVRIYFVVFENYTNLLFQNYYYIGGERFRKFAESY